ncbi:MAG TPA: hypothetical protein VH206_17470 [Xanthobacteraceae bacterium]|jgi:hypothetical protein|nr:hypothetical protein [Xanthobacteraceae bacterium]
MSAPPSALFTAAAIQRRCHSGAGAILHSGLWADPIAAPRLAVFLMNDIQFNTGESARRRARLEPEPDGHRAHNSGHDLRRITVRQFIYATLYAIAEIEQQIRKPPNP